jgi:large subunit ribosomal protein L22
MAKKNSTAHMTEVSRAKVSTVRISPQRLRLVANLIRGKKASAAVIMLHQMPNKAAAIAKKLILSAIANCESRERVDVDTLRIGECCVNCGVIIKRFMPRAHGRADQIDRRTAHMVISLVKG